MVAFINKFPLGKILDSPSNIRAYFLVSLRIEEEGRNIDEEPHKHGLGDSVLEYH